MRPTRHPTEFLTLTPVSVAADGVRTRLAASPILGDQAGLEGYLTLTNTLADRGMFFLPGAFKKTAKEQIDHTFHLLQHWPDLVLGKHVAAVEDDKGFRVTVQINEGKPLGAEVMSDYRFGIPYAWSVGFNIVRDRSGRESDDAKLDRRAVPELKAIPITELRAIEEARWFESSTVTWGALEDAGPDVINGAFDEEDDAEAIDALIAALLNGTATPDQLLAAEAIAGVLKTRAAAGSPAGTLHGTRSEGTDRRSDIAATYATIARLRAVGLECAV